MHWGHGHNYVNHGKERCPGAILKKNSSLFQVWWIYLQEPELFLTSPDPHLPKDTTCSFVCSYQSSLLQKPGASHALNHRTGRKLEDILGHSKLQKSSQKHSSGWLVVYGALFDFRVSAPFPKFQLQCLKKKKKTNKKLAENRLSFPKITLPFTTKQHCCYLCPFLPFHRSNNELGKAMSVCHWLEEFTISPIVPSPRTTNAL